LSLSARRTHAEYNDRCDDEAVAHVCSLFLVGRNHTNGSTLAKFHGFGIIAFESGTQAFSLRRLEAAMTASAGSSSGAHFG
jgi:hypothetical protein